MRYFMFVINFIIFLGSLIGMAFHLIRGQFDIAWIAVLCAAFGWGNLCVIE